MWCCRRIEVIIWTDLLKNEDVLRRIAENKSILRTIKQKEPNWTRHQWIIICCVTNTFNTGDFFINFGVKNTKMKQSPLSLIHLKIEICRPIRFNKHGTRFRNQLLHTAMWNCEETIFSVSRFENLKQTALISSFSGKNFLYTSLLIVHCHLQHRSYFFQFWEQRIRRPLL